MNRSWLVLVRKEFLELRADRRAMLFGVFLPVFLYPLLFLLSSGLQQRHAASEERIVSRVCLLGDSQVLHEALAADSTLVLVDLPDSAESALANGSIDLIVDARAGLSPMGADSSATVELRYRSTRERSRGARDRGKAVLTSLRDRERQRRYLARGGEGSLDSLAALVTLDASRASAAAGAKAGRRIVYILLMTLFVSGAALASDLVAGEKERGTLETLYLAPVPREEIALSKVVVVVAGTSLSGILSLLSIAACYSAGLMDGAANSAHASLSLGALLAAAALVVPLAILLGGILLGFSTHARSLKEAQQLVLPTMLLCFGAGLLSASQAVQLDFAVALIPVVNVALAMRDLLAGQIHPASIVEVSLASFFWSFLVLRWVAGQLRREEMVLGFDPEPFLSRSASGRRRAALLAMSLSVLVYFYLGSLLQSRFQVAGVVMSLWLLLPILGALSLWLGHNGGALVELLSLRKSPPHMLVAAVLLALGLLLPIMGGWMPLQGRFLPTPRSMAQELQGVFAGLASWRIFALGAFSPAICEELLFRGVFLGLLRRVGSTRWAVLTTAVFFGLIHLSIFRFVPTAALGVVLGLLVVRSGSILPAMLFHLSYNGSLLVGGIWFQSHEVPFALDGPLAWLLSLVLLLSGAWLLKTPRRDEP